MGINIPGVGGFLIDLHPHIQTHNLEGVLVGQHSDLVGILCSIWNVSWGSPSRTVGLGKETERLFRYGKT